MIFMGYLAIIAPKFPCLFVLIVYIPYYPANLFRFYTILVKHSIPQQKSFAPLLPGGIW